MNKIETKKIEVGNRQTLIVSVDMSKDEHFGYWRCPDGTDVKPFAFWKNGGGFQAFWNRVLHAKKLYNLDNIVFGYESTGLFAEFLVHFMHARDVHE
jgi:hypothetical protein